MPVPPPDPQGGGGGGGAVASVNAQTGVVVLDAADVGADPAGTAASAVAALVDSAPATLDTLNELAAALGDDADFAASVMATIGALPSLAEIKTALSAGGTEPITTLGETFQVIRTADSQPLLTVQNAQFHAEVGASAITLLGTLDIVDSVASLTHYQSDGSMDPATALTLGDAYAELTITDPLTSFALSHLWLEATGNELTFFEAGVKRLDAKGDGSGVSLYDPGGNPAGEFREAELEVIDPADATSLLYSSRPSGTFYAYNIAQTTNASLQLGATEEATPTAALQTNGAASALITLDDGGIQIGFNDLIAESYVAALAAAVNNGAGLGGFQLRQAAAFSMLDGSQIARIVAKPDGTGFSLYDSGGILVAQLGETAFGVLGATPYGQDAYLAPLNEAVTITLLTDVAGLINTTNARVNAINSYLIARGWEAAA